MSWKDPEAETTFRVVINREEQYSILPVEEDSPYGWTDVGKSGTKHECLVYIYEVWHDMRPLSLRKKMEEMLRREKGKQPN